MAEYKRITADFAPEAYECMTRYAEKWGISKADVIKRGLEAVQFLDKHLDKNGVFSLRTAGDRRKSIKVNLAKWAVLNGPGE